MSGPGRHTLTGSREIMAGTVGRRATTLAQLDGASWNGATLAAVSTLAFDNAAVRAYLDPADPAIVVDLERCACAAAGAYLAAVIPGSDPVDAPGPGRRSVQVVRAPQDRSKLDPAVQWRHGILAAAATRNHAAIEALASLRPEHLRGFGSPPPPWFDSEAAALAATFRRESTAGDRIVEAMRAADPAKVEPRSRDWILDVVVAELELGFRVLQHDAAGFDTVMLQAIEGHHHYYGHDGKGDSQGQLALAPLAMACFGRDLGLKTTIESDYIPRWIIERIDPESAS